MLEAWSVFFSLFVCLFFWKGIWDNYIFMPLRRRATRHEVGPLATRLGAQSSYKGKRGQWNREDWGARATRVFHFSLGFATQLCPRQNRHPTQAVDPYVETRTTQKGRNPGTWFLVAPAPISLQFHCPRPPLWLHCTPNQNRHATNVSRLQSHVQSNFSCQSQWKQTCT